MTIDTHCNPASSGGVPWNPNQIGCPPVNSFTSEIHDPVGLRRGRIIYLPSTGTSATQIDTNNPPQSDQNTFLQNCLIAGWQVVSVNEISPGPNYLQRDVSTDSGNGTRFLGNQIHYHEHGSLYPQQTDGGVMPEVFAGFSWGAWAVVAQAINKPSELIGYISRSCPTQWSNTNSTASSGVLPQMAGVNTSGLDIQTMSPIAVTSMSISGSGPWIVTLNCSPGSITGGQWVVIDSPVNGSGGANWAMLAGTIGTGFGYWQVASVTASTIVLDIASFSGTAPSGAGGTATVRTNTSLNGVSIPGALMFGGPAADLDGGFINPNDLGSMGMNAGSAVTVFAMNAETHQWSTTDSNLLSVNTYDPTVTYATGNWVWLAGNIYQALQSTTGNSPTGGSPNWSAATAQTNQGWLQTNFNSLPRIY